MGSRTGEDPRRRAIAASCVIAVTTVLAYSNTFDASFHLDDVRLVVENWALREGRWPAFGSRWVGYLSFALNYRLGGLDVFGYHLANVAIHVTNGLLVAWLAATTLRTPSLRRAEAPTLLRRHLPLTAGLLFAVHPLATQAVTYVSQRLASLATLFYLLSLVLHVHARLSLEPERDSRRRAAALYALALVSGTAAMGTKEIAFTLPLVAAGCELLFFGPSRRLLLVAPLAATALLVPLGLAGGEGLAGILQDPARLATETQAISRWTYLLTQSRVVLSYLRLLLIPVGQNVDHDVRLSYSLADPSVLLATAVLLALGSLAVFLLVRARRTNRAAGVLFFFGVAWFFVTLSVESTVIPIRDVMFEHRAYLPGAGAAIALGTVLLEGVGRLGLRSSTAVQCAVALVVTAGPLGAATWARNLVWKDELTLWSDAVAKSPEKARPHGNLGTALLEAGRLDEAEREFLEAIRLAEERDRISEAYDNLGVTLQAKGEMDDAIREYRHAIAIDPTLARAHANLGTAYLKKGHFDDAIRELLEAIRLDPRRPQAHNNLAAAYGAKGRIDDAMREYREAFRLDPRLRPRAP